MITKCVDRRSLLSFKINESPPLAGKVVDQDLLQQLSLKRSVSVVFIVKCHHCFSYYKAFSANQDAVEHKDNMV